MMIINKRIIIKRIIIIKIIIIKKIIIRKEINKDNRKNITNPNNNSLNNKDNNPNSRHFRIRKFNKIILKIVNQIQNRLNMKLKYSIDLYLKMIQRTKINKYQIYNRKIINQKKQINN